MRKNGRPPSLRDLELQRVRMHWQKARQGNQESKDELFKALSKHASVDAFVRYWVALKALPDTKKTGRARQNIVGHDQGSKTHTAPTAWERARSTLTTGPVRVVGGGLPSLGKRSR